MKIITLTFISLLFTLANNCALAQTKINALTGSKLTKADFSADVTNGCIVLHTHFTDQSTSTSAISSWRWDFGDGSQSSDKNPEHTFIAPGKYTITLIVNTGSLADTMSKTNYITVLPIPLADFSFSPDPIHSSSIITFTDK